MATGPSSSLAGGGLAARFRRQELLTGFGPAEQARLAQSSVLITRVGGLGGPAGSRSRT